MNNKRKDIFGPKKRREIMSKIGSVNTDIELILKRELREMGIHYSYKPRIVIGKPDIVFKKSRVAVFCDGDFWHGKQYYQKDIKILNDYWRKKIEYNMRRDKINTQKLEEKGWKVLRFWGSRIKKNPKKCAEKIKKVLGEKKNVN